MIIIRMENRSPTPFWLRNKKRIEILKVYQLAITKYKNNKREVCPQSSI
jgi:hypothetical protein